ncbi:MAG TPA: SH3 domain-containing C40 family peptidase [Puia sp.]|jgi:cell wall-associated NlpC family hydrolase|nr:SH3 domain-containing C40 family peptidase [Puia sp.]
MGTLKQHYFFLVSLALLLMGCATSKRAASSSNIQKDIDSVRETYASDRRTALFDVTANGNVLTGETNLPEAKNKLLSELDRHHILYTDSIRMLPDTALHGNIFAIVSISVANMRAKPGHSYEMVTQATLGTPLKVLKKEKGWYLVQTPDKYIAWTESGGIKLMNEGKIAQWQAMKKVIYIKPYGFAFTAGNTDTQTISDLVYGDILAFQKEENGFTETIFPDGRIGYIPSNEIMTYKAWATTRQPTQENLVSASKKLMGIPYLWGGTSFKGVDCSGFTRTIYFMNGLILPRDASQQAKIGEDVDTREGWQRLRPGDLLFFGIPAREGRPERVIHVGMWLGGEHDEFIQSASRVRISSFDPNAPNYDEAELHRFLRAKRITPQHALYDLRTATLYE